MRKQIVAGNWKMNMDLAETETLITDLKNQSKTSGAEVMIAPAFTNLWQAFKSLKDDRIEVIAQNMHFAANGAYTGEVSASMLKSVGVKTVILGHSERRAYFKETGEQLAKKVQTAIDNEMKVIFCFGEELEDRKSDKHFDLVETQLKEALFQIPQSSWKNIVLAYEPVWAIGTGETASPDQAQEMHKHIRTLLNKNVGKEVADSTSILYGGSVKPDNAREIFAKEDVDGGLIGGASLNAVDFVAIVNSF